jgi:tellurite resistance protein TerC
MSPMRRTLDLAARSIRHARRLVVLVIGLTVLAIGIAMIVLPGPAFIVIPIGLAILGTEFVWARRLLQHLKDTGSGLVGRVRGGDRRGGSRP